MPCQIRLKEPGWETYTGMMCGVQFTQGLSEEATDRQATQIGNIVRAERLDGSNPSSSQQMIDSRAAFADQERELAVGNVQVAKPVVIKHTREELENLAAAKGINGLREIGDKIGVRATSINRLISMIMSKQSGEPTDFIESGETGGEKSDSTEPPAAAEQKAP